MSGVDVGGKPSFNELARGADGVGGEEVEF